MLEFDKKSNLLMTNRYQYSLQDVAEPNLYRELYDYESIPKVAFNMRHVPENMPDEIWMTDTTFRDGQQSVSPFTVEQIVHLYSLMHRLGGPKGLIRQSNSSCTPIRTRKRSMPARISATISPKSRRGFAPTRRTSSWSSRQA